MPIRGRGRVWIDGVEIEVVYWGVDCPREEREKRLIAMNGPIRQEEIENFDPEAAVRFWRWDREQRRRD